MIQIFNLLSGYQSIVGTVYFHIPMLLAMLIFVRIPDDDDLSQAFPHDELKEAFL